MNAVLHEDVLLRDNDGWTRMVPFRRFVSFLLCNNEIDAGR